MRENGVIVSKHGNWVTVLLTKGEKCEGCSACSAYGKNSRGIKARNDIDAEVGDSVEVEISPKQVIGLSFLMFIFPVVAMIVGYFIGTRAGENLGLKDESSGILGALVLLIISFIFIKIYNIFWGDTEKSTAHVVGHSQLT
jgi:sigma-E factor negative regulatory protein RseC